MASAGQGGVGAPPVGGSASGAAGAIGVAPGSAVSQLSFEVLTHSLGGKYAPKNIGAIWIETGAGAFVKTLKVWAGTRARYLQRWNTEAKANRVDAVSSATLRSHQMHSTSWDLTDTSGNPVPPGAYKVVVEITDHDGKGATTEVAFTNGEPLVLMPADVTAYTAMRLTLQ